MQSILCALGIHSLDKGKFENGPDGSLAYVCRCTHCGAKVTA